MGGAGVGPDLFLNILNILAQGSEEGAGDGFSQGSNRSGKQPAKWTLHVQLIAGLEKTEIWRVGTVSIGFARRCAAAGTVSIGRCRFY